MQINPNSNLNSEEIRKLLELQRIKKQILMKYLSKEAFERLGRLRTVKPDFAEKVENAIFQAIQTGQIRKIISDEELKDLLSQLTSKRDFKIIKK